MKTIITYGTYDLLHTGHINLLKRAKDMGDKLIVVLSTDEFNKESKNKVAVLSYDERRQVVEAIKYVDLVIPEEKWEQKKDDIIKHKVDILVMGDDWKGKFDELMEHCEVVYLPRTPETSTTHLIDKISNGR